MKKLIRNVQNSHVHMGNASRVSLYRQKTFYDLYGRYTTQ